MRIIPYGVAHNSLSFNPLVHGPMFVENDNVLIFRVNVRSLKNKCFEIEAALDSLKHSFDLLTFKETWFFGEHDVITFPGYKYEGIYRTDCRGGGTSLYIKNNLEYEVLPEFLHVNKHYESIVVKFHGSPIASIYRLPSRGTKECFEYLNKVLKYVSQLNLPVVLMGDFNIDLLAPTPSSRRFYDVIQTFGCCNVICSPTRVLSGSGTLIDL